MSDGRLELHFGVLADPLQLQLASQGWAGSGKDCAGWEDDRRCWNRLRIGGLLSDAESDRVARRLLSRIARRVHPVSSVD